MLTFEEFLDLWTKAPEEIKQKVEELLETYEQETANNTDKAQV